MSTYVSWDRIFSTLKKNPNLKMQVALKVDVQDDAEGGAGKKKGSKENSRSTTPTDETAQKVESQVYFLLV